MRFHLRMATLAIGVLSLIVPHQPATKSLRVATIVRDDQHEFARGLAFGFDEANRTAALFGWRVQRVPVAPGSAIPADVSAVIGAVASANVPASLPYLSLVCDARAPRAFVLPRCDVAADGPARGTRRLVTWHASLERFGGSQLNDRYRAASRTDMTGGVWLGWLAVKMLAESAMRSGSDPSAITRHLLAPGTQFDGHKGVPLRFDASRRLEQPVYEIGLRNGHWQVTKELSGGDAEPRR